MSELLNKIKSRGYWQIIIRPRSFNPNRVGDISSLLPLLSKFVIRIRGWDFPHIDFRSSPHLDIDWIGQETDWNYHKSIWRFYQSGQFVYILAMAIDWRDESSFWPADQLWKPMTQLGVGDTIFTFAEILEFASLLALSDAGDNNMQIDIKVRNIKGRELYIDSFRHRVPFSTSYRIQMQDYPFSKNISRSDLISSHKVYAFDAAQQLFKRFGWNAPIEILQDWYDKRG
jgi:hypothetical protein